MSCHIKEHYSTRNSKVFALLSIFAGNGTGSPGYTRDTSWNEIRTFERYNPVRKLSEQF